jgi:NAD(P)H-nitrite reductase large subunit
LKGKATQESMRYRAPDFYEKNNCKTIFGTEVTKINEKTVTLENGETIPYDKLLVATGSSAVSLADVKNGFGFMTLDDALALDAALDTSKSVLIMGAGLIGLKCAEGIWGKVGSITVSDLASRILSSILDEPAAKMVQNHLESNGIKFALGQKVDPNGFDIVVTAVGVRPNTSLLNGIAEIDRGIVINEKSETTAKNIYAAGDCTQTTDISDGQKKIMALLPNAYIQGECAGINMAGGEKSFTNAIPMNAIGFCGLSIITAGNYTGDDYSKSEKNEYKRLFYSDNKLNGYIMVGNVEKAGIYTSLIRNQTPLDSIDFCLVCEKPGLMAFTKETRNSMLR